MREALIRRVHILLAACVHKLAPRAVPFIAFGFNRGNLLPTYLLLYILEQVGMSTLFFALSHLLLPLHQANLTGLLESIVPAL